MNVHLNLSGHVWPVASALDGTGLELGVPNLAAHKRPQEAQATLQTTQSSLAGRGAQVGSACDGHPHASWAYPYTQRATAESGNTVFFQSENQVPMLKV